MSMMGTLAKMAIGVAVAKGVGNMMKKGGGTGGLLGGSQSSASGGGLQDMLGSVLGGNTTSTQSQTGGLGGILEGLTGAQGGSQGGGLQDILGGLAGGGGAAGGLGGMLGGLAGGLQDKPQTESGSFGDVFNSQFDGNPEPAIEPSADQEAAAALMLRAMIQSAKSDGKFDDSEQQKLMAHLGDVTAEEMEFVQNEMKQPVDAKALAAQTPNGLQAQVYAMSVMGIDLDQKVEAQYLHDLATNLGMGQADVNGIHDQLGVPKLYS